MSTNVQELSNLSHPLLERSKVYLFPKINYPDATKQGCDWQWCRAADLTVHLGKNGSDIIQVHKNLNRPLLELRSVPPIAEINSWIGRSTLLPSRV